MADKIDYSAVDAKFGITPAMSFEETAAKRLYSLALNQYERDTSGKGNVVSDNQFYGRIINMVKATAAEKGIDIIPVSQPKSNEKRIFRSVTEYYVHNLMDSHKIFPEPVQHMVELYTSAYPLIVDIDKMQSDLEKKLTDMYVDRGAAMWDDPELTVVPEHPGRFSFAPVSVSDMAGFTIRQTADNIITEIVEGEKFPGITFMERDPDERAEKIQLSYVNIPDMHRSIYNDFSRGEGGFVEYQAKYPGMNLYNLSVVALHDRMKEVVREDPNSFLQGDAVQIVDRVELRERIEHQIETEGFGDIMVPELNGVFNAAALMPEYQEVFDELKSRRNELSDLSFDIAGDVAKGISIHNELSNHFPSIEVHGVKYEIPLTDHSVSVYKLKQINGRIVLDEKIPVDKFAELAQSDVQYRVLYISDLNDERLSKIASDVVRNVYAEDKPFTVDRPAAYAAYRIVEDGIKKNTVKSDYFIAGFDGMSVIDAGKIDAQVTNIVNKAAAKGLLFESTEPVIVDGQDFGSVKDFAYKYHEYNNEVGEYINEGVGLKEMIAKTSNGIVAEIKAARLAENGIVPLVLGTVDEAYKDRLTFDLRPVYTQAQTMVAECAAAPDKFTNAKIENHGWVETRASKVGELSVGDLKYKVVMSPDILIPGREQLVINDVVNQFLDKYIEDYGYQENVNDLDDLLPEVNGHVMFSKGWQAEIADKVKYTYDTVENVRIVASIEFPDGTVFKRNLSRFPENAGFNPDFVDFVPDELGFAAEGAYVVRAKAVEEQRVYSLMYLYNIPIKDIGLQYNAVKVIDEHNGIVRDEDGVIDTAKSNERRKTMGLTPLKSSQTRSAGREESGSFEEYRDDYVREIDEVLEEQRLLDHEEEMFNFSSDLRDRNADGKEYAGGVGNNNYAEILVPPESKFVSGLPYMDIDEFEKDGMDAVHRVMRDQLKNSTDIVEFSSGSNKDQGPLLSHVLKKRFNFTESGIRLSNALQFISRNPEALGDFYKSFADNSFGVESLNNTVYSRDAVVDAMLGQQLRFMAVRYLMMEQGASAEQVNSKPDKFVAKHPAMKYFTSMNTSKLIGIVNFEAMKFDGAVKGSGMFRSVEGVKPASYAQLRSIVEAMESGLVFTDHRNRFTAAELKQQMESGNVMLTMAEASTILAGKQVMQKLSAFVSRDELMKVHNLQEGLSEARKVFGEVKLVENGAELSQNMEFNKPLMMSLKDKLYFIEHGFNVANKPYGMNEYEYARNVIAEEKNSDTKVTPAMVHELKSVYSAKIVKNMSKYDVLQAYKSFKENKKTLLNRSVPRQFKDYVAKCGIEVSSGYTYLNFEKDCEKIPAMPQTVSRLRYYCIEGKVRKNTAGVITEAAANKALQTHSNKMFELNEGPVSPAQRKFFERFGMMPEGTDNLGKLLNYSEAMNIIVDKLVDLKALSRDDADIILRSKNLALVDHKAIFNVKNDEKSLAKFSEQIKGICRDVKVLERQYCIDTSTYFRRGTLVNEALAACRDYQERNGKICSLAEPEKLTEFIAARLVTSSAFKVDLENNRVVYYDGKGNGAQFYGSKLDNKLAAVISEVLPKPFETDSVSRCAEIITPLREKAEIRTVERFKSEAARKVQLQKQQENIKRLKEAERREKAKQADEKRLERIKVKADYEFSM